MVGCVEREGRGNRGAWAAPAGVLGGRPLWGPPSLPPVLGGPAYPGGWARRPRKEEQLETALRRRDGEWAPLRGERGLTRGRRKRPEPGVARGWRSRGSRPLPQEVARGKGARGPAGEGRRRGWRVTKTLCSRAAQRNGGPGESGVWEGRVSGSEEWMSCLGLKLCSPAGWGEVGKPSGLEVLPSGTRASDPRLPCSWLSVPPSHSLSGAQAFRLPAGFPLLCPPVSGEGLPCAPLLPSCHASSLSPSPPPNPLDFSFNLLNKSSFKHPRIPALGNAQGEENCREKELTPGCRLDPLELGNWGYMG